MECQDDTRYLRFVLSSSGKKTFNTGEGLLLLDRMYKGKDKDIWTCRAGQHGVSSALVQKELAADAESPFMLVLGCINITLYFTSEKPQTKQEWKYLVA